MYSRDETASAVLAFYQQIVKHPYLDATALKLPPTEGWDSIDVETLKARGKNDTVIDLLRHLPYLRNDRGDRLLVQFETVPICYTSDESLIDDVYPLPSHCVYLTEGVDREGFSLIMDTERGTVTAYSTIGYRVEAEYDDLEDMPEAKQWQGHLTLPVVEFFEQWTLRYAKLVWMLAPNTTSEPTTGLFYRRSTNRLEEEELCNSDLEDWLPDLSDAGSYRRANLLHIAEVYETHLRHGWPSNFNKEECRAELLKLIKRKSAEDNNRFVADD